MAKSDTQEEFWGITLSKEQKSHTWSPISSEEEDIEHKIQVRQACLGPKAKDAERNIIEAHTEDDNGKKISCAIVSLRVGVIECIHLELGFTNSVKFVLKEGNGPVSLCGSHLMALPLDLYNDDSDESETDEVPQLVPAAVSKELPATEVMETDEKPTEIEEESSQALVIEQVANKNTEESDDLVKTVDKEQKVSNDKSNKIVDEKKSKKRGLTDEKQVVVSKKSKNEVIKNVKADKEETSKKEEKKEQVVKKAEQDEEDDDDDDEDDEEDDNDDSDDDENEDDDGDDDDDEEEEDDDGDDDDDDDGDDSDEMQDIAKKLIGVGKGKNEMDSEEEDSDEEEDDSEDEKPQPKKTPVNKTNGNTRASPQNKQKGKQKALSLSPKNGVKNNLDNQNTTETPKGKKNGETPKGKKNGETPKGKKNGKTPKGIKEGETPERKKEEQTPKGKKDNQTPKGKKESTNTPHTRTPEELKAFLLKSPNLPKKYQKFANLLKNNLRVTDEKTQKEMWAYVQANKK